jgi:hypothetical protein
MPKRTSPGRVPGARPILRRGPRVFVSYAGDSSAHTQLVCRLCTLLRSNSMHVALDQFAGARRRDWADWACQQIESADYVIVVASPAYKRAADGNSNPGSWGAQFEAIVLREKLCADRRSWLPRILPVVLPGGHVDDIPIYLQPHTASHFAIDELSTSGITHLLAALAARP